MKAVLWNTALVFGSLFGLSMGLFIGVIFGLGLTVGLDTRTAANGAGGNAVSPAKTIQSVDVAVNPKLVSAAMH
jgi:hypothetical protein